MRLSMLIYVLANLCACHEPQKPPRSTNITSSNHTNPINTQPSTSQQVDCSLFLTHTDPNIKRAYEESFKQLGAFLLYYQQKLVELGEAKATEHMTALDYSGETHFEANISIKNIDKQLNNPIVRKIWEDRCQYPANFLCVFFKFVNYAPLGNKKPKNIEEIFSEHDPYSYKSTLFAWFDDGLWGMQTLIFGKSTGPKRDDLARFKANKWCY